MNNIKLFNCDSYVYYWHGKILFIILICADNIKYFKGEEYEIYYNIYTGYSESAGTLENLLDRQR